MASRFRRMPWRRQSQRKAAHRRRGRSRSVPGHRGRPFPAPSSVLSPTLPTDGPLASNQPGLKASPWSDRRAPTGLCQMCKISCFCHQVQKVLHASRVVSVRYSCLHAEEAGDPRAARQIGNAINHSLSVEVRSPKDWAVVLPSSPIWCCPTTPPGMARYGFSGTT